MEQEQNTKRKVFVARSREAAELIEKLVGSGMTADQIGKASRVSARTVYRWWKEGYAPHPIMLDSLKKLALKKGIAND